MTLVQTFEATASPFIEKTVSSADGVERLTIDGAPAYWITGSHGFAFQSPNGVAYDEQRLADRTLLLERDGQLTRVEGAAQPRARGRDRALSSVTGRAASSPAARNDAPCAAAPPPTARRARR